MTHILTANVVRGVLPAAAALLVVGVTPAQGTVQEARTGDWLYLTVTRGDARSGEPRSTLLRCDPPRDTDGPPRPATSSMRWTATSAVSP
ncbi:hypothetical protein [Streptomyces sp. F001]|uniref:hypothetical protein n=1 Tax=Streptomyces sp. F001 TaxID=1510026 RepID=UPI00320BAA0E